MDIKSIKKYIPEEIKIDEIINVFNILYKKELITQQEQQRAINFARHKYK